VNTNNVAVPVTNASALLVKLAAENQEDSAKASPKPRPIKEPAVGGFVALGYEGRHSVIWSAGRQVIERVSASDIVSPGVLMSVCGSKWLESKYGTRIDSETGKEVKCAVDFKAVGGKIADACTAAGAYNTSAERGAGVWRSDDSDDVLVVNSKQVFRTDGQVVERIGTKYVYKHSRDLGLTPDVTPATRHEMKALWEVLKQWNFKRESDSRLMLGWIASGMLAGALPWRTHCNLTGPAYAGKTALVRAIKNLLGSACIAADNGSSVSGLRQKLGNDALVYLADEAEADGKTIAEVLAFLRTASAGSEILKGTQDQSGRSFTVRCVGLLAGIVPPVMNAADASRFLLVEILPLPVGADIVLPHLAGESAESEKDANALGLKLFARMTTEWPRYKRAVKTIQTVMRANKDSSRFADTMGGVIGAAWIALADEELTEQEAGKWVASFDLSISREMVTSTDDSGDLLELVMSYTVMSKGTPMMLSQLVQKAVNKDDFSSHLLSQYGIKATRIPSSTCIQVAIWDKSPQLSNLLRDSRWSNGRLRDVLSRVPGAVIKSGERIGGDTKSGVVIVPTKIQADAYTAGDTKDYCKEVATA
jgi:hypothetical protein